MNLLDFARGPALEWSLMIMVAGILWRLLGSLLLARAVALSRPRSTKTFIGGLRTVLTRSLPAKNFEHRIRFQHYTGYLFHIGLFVVIFLFVPHIEFLKDLIGLSWPGLPNDIVMVVGAVTVGTLVALLVRRMTHPVLRTISSPDDYLAWFVTTAPVVTGMMAYAHIGPRYETMLAIHILSVELLFIWIPFSKLMHMFYLFPVRAQNGAKFERRGVRA